MYPCLGELPELNVMIGQLASSLLLLAQSDKLEKVVTVDFKKHPAQKVGTRSRAVSTQRFVAGSPFPVPEISESKACRDSGKLFQQFSRNCPAIFLGNPRIDPGNSHTFPEFSDRNGQIKVEL